MNIDNRSTFKRRDTAELFEKGPQEQPALVPETAVEAQEAVPEPTESVSEREASRTPRKKINARRLLALIVVIVAIVALGGLNVLQYFSYQQDKEVSSSNLSAYKAALAERDELLLEQYTLVQSLSQQASENSWINPWIEENVAFIPDNGERLFHRFSCPHWQSWDGSYWVFNVEYAEFLRYEPHYCW